MKLSDIYKQDTTATILLRGLFALLIGLFLGLIYTAITGQNGFIRLAYGIFGVPVTMTLLKLLYHLAPPIQTPTAAATGSIPKKRTRRQRRLAKRASLAHSPDANRS